VYQELEKRKFIAKDILFCLLLTQA